MAEAPARFEVVAGVGVPPVLLGMTADEVRRAMGEPDRGSVPGVWTYHDGCLLVNSVLDGEVVDRVTYVEVSACPGIEIVYRGASIFALPPDEAAALVGGPGPFEFTCEDLDDDVGMYRCGGAGDGWDSIGVGFGGHFRAQRARRASP